MASEISPAAEPLKPASWIQNGTMTIRSPKGEHRTLQIRTVREGMRKGERFVELLVGPDNTSSFQPFGALRGFGLELFSSKRSGTRKRGGFIDAGFAWNEQAAGEIANDFEKIAAMLFDLLLPRSFLRAQGYELLHEGRCLICNRKLTTPESIVTGVGPICAGRM